MSPWPKRNTHYIIKNVSLLKEISCRHKYASFCSAQNTSSHVHMNIYKTHLYLLLILILNSDHLKAVSGCQFVTGDSWGTEDMACNTNTKYKYRVLLSLLSADRKCHCCCQLTDSMACLLLSSCCYCCLVWSYVGIKLWWKTAAVVAVSRQKMLADTQHGL